MTHQKFKVGDLVTRNGVEKPRESIHDPFAGVAGIMEQRMPARVTKTQEFEGGQAVYLDIPGFETVSYNSAYLQIADESEVE